MVATRRTAGALDFDAVPRWIPHSAVVEQRRQLAQLFSLHVRFFIEDGDAPRIMAVTSGEART